MVRYVTLKKEAKAEQTIERSHFISHVAPVSSRAEAEAFINGVRSQHKEATHNVPVFVLGERMEIQWTSDDGEPQGTAGPPILQMFVKEGLTNIVCVVTRYFGGKKLGLGGLVRAYTSTAKLAVSASGLHEVKEMVELKVRLPYNVLGKLQNLEREKDFEIKHIVYAENLEITMTFEPEMKDEVSGLLADLNSGSPKTIEEIFTLI
ncbi:MAG: YigZ family protein [Clostridia bacterium]|nr:YigZ family protein [Clostridia bacterium]